LLSRTHLPSSPNPRRAISLVVLVTALALGGLGTAGIASAATAGPAASLPAAAARHVAASQPAAAARHVAASQPASSWHAVMEAAAGQRGSAALTPSQQLLPAAVSGPQAYLPMTTDRVANAATIVQQALAKHMGLRSAVIAVATAMQESALQNLQYGTYDSLGLFQQRPSAGWGTPAQITNPVYASDAFLNALAQYQAGNPGWATQPLWQAAQGVQNSGFPYAYAKWEVQAAQIVADATRHLL
jgi:hypothetical protein